MPIRRIVKCPRCWRQYSVPPTVQEVLCDCDYECLNCGYKPAERYSGNITFHPASRWTKTTSQQTGRIIARIVAAFIQNQQYMQHEDEKERIIHEFGLQINVLLEAENLN